MTPITRATKAHTPTASTGRVHPCRRMLNNEDGRRRQRHPEEDLEGRQPGVDVGVAGTLDEAVGGDVQLEAWRRRTRPP